MKKLLGIIVLGLLLSGNAYADTLIYECSNAKYSYVKFDLDLNRKIIDLEFTDRNGKTDTNRLGFNSYDNEKVSSSAFTWYYGTDQRYVNKAGKTEYYKCKYNKSNTTSSSSASSQTSTKDKITQAKQICTDLGFQQKTEKHADCSMQMMSIQFETTNKVASASGGTTQEVIVTHRNDYDIWDALLDFSAAIDPKNKTTTSSSSSNRGTSCVIGRTNSTFGTTTMNCN